MTIETNQRLTTAIKETIVTELIAHRFTGEVKLLTDDFAALAQEVYERLYSADARKKIAALPDGWLPKTSRVGAQFGGGYNYSQRDFNGAVTGNLAKIYRPESILEKPIAFQHYNGCGIRFEPTDDISLKYEALKSRMQDLSTEVDTASRAAKAAVSSVTTIKRLCEVWPEVEPFCKKFTGSKPHQLPALPTDRLNTIFDLPVSAAA